MTTIPTRALGAMLLAHQLILTQGSAAAPRRAEAPSGEAVTAADREKSALETMCGTPPDPQADARDQGYIELLGSTLLLGDDQRDKLKDYHDAQAQALGDARARLCERRPDPATLPGALDFRRAVLQSQLDAMNAVNPKLLDFYNSLNSAQKARFDAIRSRFGQAAR